MNRTTPPQETERIAAVSLIHERMRAQSLRAPWRRIAEVADQIVAWRAFALWVRAIVDVESGLPVSVRDSIEHRCPGFLQRRRADAPASGFWAELMRWPEHHVYPDARLGGWIEAAHYYSGLNPRSELVWQAWEESAAAWVRRRPTRYPSFDEWLANALRKLDIPEPEELEPIAEAEAFALWTTLVVTHGTDTTGLQSTVAQRCPDLLAMREIPEPGDREGAVRFLQALQESLAKRIPRAESAPQFPQCCLRIERIRSYFADCNLRWSATAPETIPSFEQWLSEVDRFLKFE